MLEQLQRFSSAASSSHTSTPEGSFSSRLRDLLRWRSEGEETAGELGQARGSLIKAVGLSSPEATDGVPPEVKI